MPRKSKPKPKSRQQEENPPENLWVQQVNRRDPANPTDVPAGLEDEAPMTDAMAAWVRANCKFASNPPKNV